jgi:hypothetical protein
LSGITPLLFLLLVLRTNLFAGSPIRERADRFLAPANAGYQALYRVNSEALWLFLLLFVRKQFTKESV